ncbi:hypothetical protein F5Y17DRAFT_427580 [Xylariaceae sp. FL0594]|nr:hypothetical protein F5Y17DRAFT_427580 [Xylariaceae sp. FL0594]
MSVEIWPPIAPDQLKIEEDATQARELTWLLDSFQTTLVSLKHGLEECYALLAPIEAGSTLVLSTPRAELVKGHVTRVGTRLVKGTIHTRLRTAAPLTLSIDPSRPIHLAPLSALNTLLTEADDLASLCVSEGDKRRRLRFRHSTTTNSITEDEDQKAASFLSSQLRVLAQHIDEASSILKGGTGSSSSSPEDLTTTTKHNHNNRPGTASTSTIRKKTIIPGSDWTQSSTASTSFNPPLPKTLSFHLTIQDACLVLHLRALESADAPVHLGTKLALAIGTARRLEHDEAERVFLYRHNNNNDNQASTTHQTQSDTVINANAYPTSGSRNSNNGSMMMNHDLFVERVYVREKVCVESADPNLLSMATKLTALSNTLCLARRNLAAVMGVEFDED